MTKDEMLASSKREVQSAITTIESLQFHIERGNYLGAISLLSSIALQLTQAYQLRECAQIKAEEEENEND